MQGQDDAPPGDHHQPDHPQGRRHAVLERGLLAMVGGVHRHSKGGGAPEDVHGTLVGAQLLSLSRASGRGEQACTDETLATAHLLAAARRGDLEACRALLAGGAVHADALDHEVLMEAAQAGHASVVQLLLSQEVRPARADAHGSMALCRAAFFGRYHVCVVLVQADPPARVDARGFAACRNAAHYGHAATVRALLTAPLRAGVVPGDLDRSAMLVAAAKHGHLDVCSELLAAHRPAWADDQDSEALICAARGAHVRVCLLLLSQPERPARADARDSELLVLAVKMRSPSLFFYALEGAPVRASMYVPRAARERQAAEAADGCPEAAKEVLRVYDVWCMLHVMHAERGRLLATEAEARAPGSSRPAAKRQAHDGRAS